MLAKALAKELNATFINIAASVLTNKWFVAGLSVMGSCSTTDSE